MFKNAQLEDKLKYSHTIENNQAVWAEWNLNESYNISKVGNYRYRPGTTDPKYATIRSIYETNDTGNYYTGATDSDVVINAGFDDEDNPAYLIAPKKKISLLYSLDDCFKQNRPRSGINKLLYLGVSGTASQYGQYIDSLNTFRQIRSATVTYAESLEGNIVFTADHNFIVGDYVKITGVDPISYNFTDPRIILSVTENTFTVSGNTEEIYQSGGYAQVGYLSSVNVARRPRYYMASRYDDFKYWTSYRTESEQPIDGTATTVEYGIAQNLNTGTQTPSYYIYDAAPFVVYNEPVPTNKIVIKMQTNVGEINNGPYRIGNKVNVPDPLYGNKNQTTPKRWAVQILDSNNNWNEIISFNENTKRSDGTDIIQSDGHVEIEYGLIVPSAIDAQTFTLIGETLSSSVFDNTIAPSGYAYILKQNELDKGVLRISDGSGSWAAYPANYAWRLAETNITKSTQVVTQLSNPKFYVLNDTKIFREFQFAYGLRIVVDTMNKINATFDLIELSPRLVADISKKTISFSVKKTLSDLGSYSMPTGNLLASTGQISIFDDDLSFNEQNVFDNTTNTGSIISNYLNTKIKFLFFDIVKNVNNYDYYIPIKTLYSERIPQVSDNVATISLNLRDLFYFLETKKSPELLLTNVSLSYAVTVLLDNVGFSNYVFKRTSEDEELIIPFFFVGPDQNIAETLQQLAISSQSAMFFDEYNNLVIMSKNYILPSQSARPTDLTLYGQEEQLLTVQNGASAYQTALPNIMNISSQDKLVYNGGEINYTTRYIQKTIGSISQAPYIDDYKTFVYKPVLLWEVAGEEATKTINESATQASGYSLSAMPLKTTLSSQIPTYENGTVLNNIIDFGESIYWLGNYAGYFYANGEVIRYDAVEYSIAGVGNVWIKNNQEYQAYFAKLRFNGKMYPTGRVRIYTSVKDNTIKEHGRGQFGTSVVEHLAGLDENTSWVSDSNVKGFIQNSKDYLFNTNQTIIYPNNIGIDEAGNSIILNNETYTSQSYAIKSTRNGIIKNFMANTNITENDVNYYKTAKAGSVQTSALIFNGPSTPSQIDPAEFVTYSYKKIEKPYRHFGTRLRIIGKIESGTSQNQTPVGSFTLFSPSQASSQDPSKQVSITGGSGGLAFGLNKETNVGYYFEVAALNQNNVSSYKNNSNRVSYTIEKSPVVQATSGVVTVTLSSQHDFEVGTSVLVSGLVDDANKTASATQLNGQYLVTEISIDRKMFKYQIPSPNPTSVSITSASADGSKIIYTAEGHNFSIGQKVNITGMSASPFNITDATITNVNNPINPFFDVTNKSLTSNVATLTTSVPHSFTTGQKVTVSGVDSTFNGVYTITGTPTTNTLTYNKTAANVSSASVIPNGTVKLSYNDTFTVSASVSGTLDNQSGTATYIPLTTTSSNGGTVTKNIAGDTVISNVFFYKVGSGTNTADIIKNERKANPSTGQNTLVVLTTLRDHSFQVGEQINVSGASSSVLNGTWQISAVTARTIQYNTTTSGIIAETDLNPLGLAEGINKIAIPQILWRGLTDILVDDGKFTTQSRLTTSEKTTVYDLSVEYIDIGTVRQFYLYLNGKQIAVVNDENPLPKYNNLALFVRGTSRIMFENIFALADNFSENNAKALQLPVSKVFGDELIMESEAINKYALSGIVQNTYLSGINSETSPQYDIYYEEFGTIMREAAYFNIRYDRAYPALYAKIAETINRVRGYTVSGFIAGSYGAEFLIFNAIDKNLSLDDTSGNYLRVLGIAFTQNTTHKLSVDDFFRKNSNFVNEIYGETQGAEEYQKLYSDVLNSRNKYGKNDFAIDTQYVQTDAAAESMMDWIIKKVIYPRKTIGIATFAAPHLQLGDIVQINYKDNGLDIVSPETTRFVVYNIEYQKSDNEFSNIIHLAEV